MMTPSTPDLLIVSNDQLDVRLDKLLSSHYSNYSRTYFQYLIEKGLVLVSGKPVKKKDKLKAGDEIEVCFELTPEMSLEPENIPLEILYEDEHLMAINKPVGMVVHPAPGHYCHTFVNALLYHCKALPSSDNLRPGIVHRLDKDTSGLLLAAKTTEAHQKLITLFCERRIEKRYLAICLGNPGNITIDAPIHRHKLRRKEMAISEEGKSAISRIRTLATDGDLSLVEVELVTGRTHQIRVHLKHKGTPVLGDPVYGSTSANQKFEAPRQLLHAYQIKFLHPITGIPINLSAPIPSDFLKHPSALFQKFLAFGLT